MKIELELSEDFESRMVERIAESVREQTEDQITESVDAAIDAQIKADIDRIVSEKVSTTVEQVLDRGWPKLNRYGDPEGENFTLQDRVRNAISETLNHREYGDRPTSLEKIVKEKTEAALKVALVEDIERARKGVKEQVDALLNQKLRDALATALGLTGGGK